MTRSLNICLISYFPPQRGGQGGIATYTYNLALGLAKLGHHVQVITQDWGDDTVDEIGGVRVYRVSIPAPSWRRGTYFINWRFYETRQILLWNLQVSQVVRRILASEPLDVIQSQEYQAPALFTALRQRQIPMVVRLHGPAYLCRQISGVPAGWSRWDTQISERLEYHMMRCAQAVTSASRKLAEDVAKQWRFDAAAVQVIPNPIDYELFCPAEGTADDDILLYVGRISRLKGVETLIEALPTILGAFPNIRVRLVGKDHPSGPNGSSMTGYLRLRLRDLGIPETTIGFVGPLEWSTLPTVYRNIAICVIPSFYENFPNTCLEAMASGCAVVASAVGGIPEIITDQVDGLLVPPGSPEALAAAVVRLLSDPPWRRQLGMRARATICDRFSAEVICAETERVYRSLLV